MNAIQSICSSAPWLCWGSQMMLCHALQPFVVPLSHAGLRARSLAIAGAPTLARATAEQGGAFLHEAACDLHEHAFSMQSMCAVNVSTLSTYAAL